MGLWDWLTPGLTLSLGMGMVLKCFPGVIQEGAHPVWIELGSQWDDPTSKGADFPANRLLDHPVALQLYS